MSVIAQRGNGKPAAAVDEHIPPVPFEHEELVVRRGKRSGCYVIVAIHSTALGPALRSPARGGARSPWAESGCGTTRW